MLPPIPARNEPRASSRRRASWTVAASISAIMLILGILVTAFAWPWLPQLAATRAAAFPYTPYAHGDASLRVTLDAAYTPFAWSSDNLTSIPSGQIFAPTFPANLGVQLMRLVPELANTGALPRATQLFRSQSRTMLADGTITDSETYLLRRADDATAVSDAVLGITVPGIDLPLLYDPPLNATIGAQAPFSTTQQGTLAESFDYTFSTQQRPRNAISTPLGTWQDCREVKATLHIANADAVIINEATTTVYCAGYGIVAQTTHNANGSDFHTYVVHNIGALSPSALAPVSPPLVPLNPDQAAANDLTAWEATEFANLASGARTTLNTIAPTYVAASTPFLLTATRDGPLVALDTRQPDPPLWEFHTGGTVHSQPTIDPTTGIIYFGSSDKHLYALTQDGLILWKFGLQDNVAARPLVIDEQVFAVAEDGALFALDKVTGALRWQQRIGSAVIASPASLKTTAQSLVIVGSDEGQLSAYDANSGEHLWANALDAPIRVSPVADGATVYVATTAASLFAFTADGGQIWREELTSEAVALPALNATHLFVVEKAGWVTAYVRATGSRAWRSNEPRYAGRPLWVSPTGNSVTTASPSLIVATSDGAIVAFDANGALQRKWKLPVPSAVQAPSAVTPTFGPTFGGGSIWLGDLGTRIYRLGAPINAPIVAP